MSDKDDTLRLEQEAQDNVKGKSLYKMAEELRSRVGDVSGNLELGPEHFLKVEKEIENDIVKSRALAHAIFMALDRLDMDLARTRRMVSDEDLRNHDLKRISARLVG